MIILIISLIDERKFHTFHLIIVGTFLSILKITYLRQRVRIQTFKEVYGHFLLFKAFRCKRERSPPPKIVALFIANCAIVSYIIKK